MTPVRSARAPSTWSPWPHLAWWRGRRQLTGRRGGARCAGGGPMGSGPLTGKVGDGRTHLGEAAPVRAERTMAWLCSTDAEVLRLAPVAPEVPTIPKGEGEGEARFN
jgi:hypothetical protein